MGIGYRGTLPWPSLKKEMAFFARVTKRLTPLSHAKMNAVIMGRKTWESIPPKFRPLKERLNIVVSRTPERLVTNLAEEKRVLMVAVGSLAAAYQEVTNRSPEIDRVFVIGGAEIYIKSLEIESVDRILWTRVKKEYECDVSFPLRLGEVKGWTRAGEKEMADWTGEDCSGVHREDEVEYEFTMWKKAQEQSTS